MRPALLGLATAGLASLSAPAFAQLAPVAEATGEAGDIIVTAQLREQNSIDVPVAVSAVTGNELDRFGLSEFEEVGRFIPGFDVQNQSPNNPGFVIRGITSDSGTAYNEPRVSVFQDGVSISKSRGSYVELFDMERVEVAKGPQSTLYGRGALIGAVNLIQNKADPKSFAAYASGSYGNYNAWTAEGMANAPLGEGVALRVSGRIRKADGYVKNLLDRDRDFNSDDTKAIRGAFHAETGGLTFDVIGNYQKDEPTGTSFKSIAYRPTDPATGVVIGTAGRNSGAALAPGAGFEGGKPLGLDREVWGVTGIANLALGNGFTLTSISAYRRFDALEIFDADGISLPVLTAAEDARGRQTSQELRLRYDDDRLSAFVGASYFHEKGSQRGPAQFDERMVLGRFASALNGGGAIPGRAATDPTPAALFGSTAFTSQLLRGVAGASGVALSAAQATAIAANLKSNHLETSTNFARTKAFDIFGDATFKVSDQFEIGAGLRWTRDDKDSSFTSAVLNGRSILGTLIAALGQPAAQRTALLGALAVPGAATIPPSVAYPVPLIGLGLQPTAGNGGTDSASLKDDGLSWRLTARYSPTDDASIYANYARGRRPRVLAASSPSAPFGPTRFGRLPNETVDSYEVGAKGAFMDRKLILDGSVFYYKYKNFQTTVQQGTQIITTNAGRAQTYGFEGDMRYVPNDTVALIATYAYNHSRLKTGVRDGNRLRLSPDHSASIGAIVGVPVGPGRVTFTPSLTWQSKVFFDDDNDLPALQQVATGALVADNIQDEQQKGYALANARIGYELDNGLQIEAYVDNLFDKKYIKDAGNTGDSLGLPTFIAGEPRFYGVRVAYRFGGAK
ncbi:TonB-dependent receptor [Sphingomonas montanisoli]|uniref:TonB-dependent receptor plug domain-containing protein n=1 Tax=Sphingomonas montanisoli TaxID=2606412 RepID=A0A5D9CDB5_9SPHN|nr:TonB-dependent receptor [Sphingomonas montanisoli]TZG29346.1 TonB-dependent receptor plug domain-containing protein [Sphingomonas montanisoli]